MRMKAIWNGAVLADSGDTVVVDGNHYFPRESLTERFFEPSPKRSVCPWKGLASYYSVTVNGRTNPDAAWEYRKPLPSARKVQGRVAFSRRVQVIDHDSRLACSVRNTGSAYPYTSEGD